MSDCGQQLAKVEDELSRHRLLPLAVIEAEVEVGALGDALVSAGLPCVEVAFRTPKAEAALGRLADDGRLLVGAGTVTNVEQAERAHAAGAQFAVSPGLDEGVMERCHSLGLPLFPGVATPTELQAARSRGHSTVKLFPAEVLGGVRMLNSLSGPFPEVRFIPTGGISRQNAAEYLKRPDVLAVGGSWMLPPALLRMGSYREIESLVGEAVSLAATNHPQRLVS